MRALLFGSNIWALILGSSHISGYPNFPMYSNVEHFNGLCIRNRNYGLEYILRFWALEPIGLEPRAVEPATQFRNRPLIDLMCCNGPELNSFFVSVGSPCLGSKSLHDISRWSQGKGAKQPNKAFWGLPPSPPNK